MNSKDPQIQSLRQREAYRSQPDYVTFIPEYTSEGIPESGNEHFLVFESAKGALMAVWTSRNEPMPNIPPGEGPNNHILFSKSLDGGVTWETPKHLAGPRPHEYHSHIANWAFPMVSQTGRIYVLWNQSRGIGGSIYMHTGGMAGRYSDDEGITWSEIQDIPFPNGPLDDPQGKIPPEWIVWQIPTRDLKDRFYVGFSHWVNKTAGYKHPPGRLGWTWLESVVEFMRFENIDNDPEPKDIQVVFRSYGDEALRVPHWRDPLVSVAQEPSLVRLPDQRLFCTMRTNTGYIWYSLSEDDGEHWCMPRPLLDKDFGRPLLQPVGCCPIYDISAGRYLLLYHNNRGNITPLPEEPEETACPRNPAYFALGEFRPKAHQPIWFSKPKVFINIRTEGVDGKPNPTQSIACYTSFTNVQGNRVLWYPDRKYFLLGKRVRDEFLADMQVPD